MNLNFNIRASTFRREAVFRIAPNGAASYAIGRYEERWIPERTTYVASSFGHGRTGHYNLRL
jgi:hypothetical protein